MEKKVVVLTPNGRRATIKVTPNTTLLMVLEEVCSKHNYDSEEYVLRHHSKEVDLSQMFRFSGLPNHCLLEMWRVDKKRAESSVDICIQLESGSRQQDTFVPNVSLWDVIEKLCPDSALAFSNPTAVYMRDEIVGKENLTKNTLKSLGITSGRALIRFLDKKTELKSVPELVTTELKDAEMKPVERNANVPPLETVPHCHSAKTKHNNSPSGGFILTKDLLRTIKKSDSNVDKSHRTEHMEIDNEASSIHKDNVNTNKYNWDSGKGRKICDTKLDDLEQIKQAEIETKTEPDVHIIGERSATLYCLNSMQKAVDDQPDSFYDLTVNDLKLVLRDLKKISVGNEEMPLLTEKLRLLEEDKKKLKTPKYENCAIRIKFPDGYVLQGIFKPNEGVTNVIDFIRNFMEQPEREFYLFTIPPKTVLCSDKTLLDLNLVPTGVIYFCFSENQQNESNIANVESDKNIIRAEFLQKLSTEAGAFYVSNKFRTLNSQQENLNSITKSPTSSTGAVPKRRRNDNNDDFNHDK